MAHVYAVSFKFLYWVGFSVRWFGWRRHFIHVAEFAEVVAVALNGAVIAKQRAEFATTTAQILIVHQPVVAPKGHNDINFGIVRVFRGAMEQVLVQLQ